jgi:hypothetical protein
MGAGEQWLSGGHKHSAETKENGKVGSPAQSSAVCRFSLNLGGREVVLASASSYLPYLQD